MSSISRFASRSRMPCQRSHHDITSIEKLLAVALPNSGGHRNGQSKDISGASHSYFNDSRSAVGRTQRNNIRQSCRRRDVSAAVSHLCYSIPSNLPLPDRNQTLYSVFSQQQPIKHFDCKKGHIGLILSMSMGMSVSSITGTIKRGQP